MMPPGEQKNEINGDQFLFVMDGVWEGFSFLKHHLKGSFPLSKVRGNHASNGLDEFQIDTEVLELKVAAKWQ